VSKLGRETPSQIRAWSLIRNEKKNNLSFLEYCHATEKAITCAMRCQSSQLTGWWTRKGKKIKNTPVQKKVQK
jgi:hypothetical protein